MENKNKSIIKTASIFAGGVLVGYCVAKPELVIGLAKKSWKGLSSIISSSIIKK